MQHLSALLLADLQFRLIQQQRLHNGEQSLMRYGSLPILPPAALQVVI